MKNAAANDKLKKMVKDQQEAEKKKVKISVKSLCVASILFTKSLQSKYWKNFSF